jgi:hypothetical protein
VRIVLDLVFPNPDDDPSAAAKKSEVPRVTLSIPGDLQPPIFGKLLSPHREPPAMPEIPVYEDGHALASKHEIGPPRHFPHILPKSAAPRVKDAANRQLRARVRAPDARHRAAALLWREIVSHRR